MSQSTITATRTIVEKLQGLSLGLLYPSETDMPFEVVFYPYPPATSPLDALVVRWAGAESGTLVTTQDLPSFFRHLTGDSATENQQTEAYRKLQDFLETHLQDVRVYRVGNRKITAFILGKTHHRDYAGLKTQLVET